MFFIIAVYDLINIFNWYTYKKKTENETDFVVAISEMQHVSSTENAIYYDNSEFIKNLDFLDINFDNLILLAGYKLMVLILITHLFKLTIILFI